MGQARRRSREIQELKRSQPAVRLRRSPVHAFGAFYHDDEPDGIGVFLTTNTEPSPGWVNSTFDILCDLVLEEVRSTGPTAEARRARADLAWENLHDNIVLYNQSVFGTQDRDMQSQPREITLDAELIEIFVNIITNIWYLEVMGEIPNDATNGLVIEFAG